MRDKAGAGFCTLVLTALMAVSAADGPGAVSLFDGKSLEGWVSVGTDRFAVHNGVIVNDGGTGWLRTAKAYKNFELHAEYRIVRPGSDSGIFFRATAESTPKSPGWPVRGYQLQVTDADSHLMIFGHGAPVKFERKADALKTAQKAAGEWQSLTLTVVGGRAEVSLNGTLVTVSDAIALPDGHIGLQGENGHLEWRALTVKVQP
jgi:Domain of Unknown Function (DUF1080)